MKRASRPPEGPVLFDLPLAAEEPQSPDPPPAADAPRPRPAKPEEPEPLTLFPEGEGEEAPAKAALGARPAVTAPSLASRRLRAGLLDLAALAAVLVILVSGSWAMGVPPRLAYWPAVAVFLAVFSFLYHSLPLAFWGQTPAMAVIGIISRAAGDQPLTFAQTALRWLGSTLTVVAAGLPLLLNRTGRSLADRLSGSTTRIR